jgi:hypothetical protein
MARSRKPREDLADRRGVFEEWSGSWSMTLIRSPERAGPVDLDELVDRLTGCGVVGASRRDVAADLHAGRIPPPAGSWALLVALPGQRWAYLLPGNRSSAPAAEIARSSGLRTIDAGHSDFSGSVGFRCFEGDQALVMFDACHLEGEVVEQYGGGGLGDVFEQTLFTGSRLPKDWIKAFEHPAEVQEALAREFDAFIPYIGASGFKGVVEIYGYDRREFKAGDYLRIDLIGFGDARLEPSAADHQLLAAITAGDVDAVRVAAAAGADMHRLPGHAVSPLSLALGWRGDGKPRRAMVAALLELGADVNQTNQELPVHIVLDPIFADQAELIDLLELLTDHGADVKARGRELMSQTGSPLHTAARKGWLAVAKFLMSKGADVRAVDALGHTPRQTAEAAAASVAELKDDEETTEKYRAMIAFLTEAEAGRADFDWRADAVQASRRELRRKRKMKLAFGRIGEGMKALGRISGDEPTAEALVDAVVFAQPDAIHLTPLDDAAPVDAETAAVLVADGFEPIGRYAIPEMPKIRLEAFFHPREHLYAALYDAAGRSILDLVRYDVDGGRLTVTNNATTSETHFDTPDRRTIRLPGLPAFHLLSTLRAEPEPAGGVAPVTAAEFAPRFEDAYRREIKARKRQGRRQPPREGAEQ